MLGAVSHDPVPEGTATKQRSTTCGKRLLNMLAFSRVGHSFECFGIGLERYLMTSSWPRDSNNIASCDFLPPIDRCLAFT